jgi:ribosomal protein S18 acetylase RimI-like enzyme
MRLGPREKDADMLERLLDISNKSFDGVERPPREAFKAHFLDDEVFTGDCLTPYSFAIVTERGGPYIWTIAVIDWMRRTGEASRLLKEIAEYYKPDNPEIKLACKVDNVAAQIMYLKAGYRVVRVMPRYYGAEDGLLLRRIL